MRRRTIREEARAFLLRDLVATALGSCILTMMGMMARPLNVDLAGSTATVEKEMTSTPPRMIQRLATKIRVPLAVSDEARQKMERAAHTCPVHRSLHPDIEKPIEFIWG